MNHDPPGVTLLRPWSLAAVALLVFNDHWLKQHAPGVLSGKLSDFAGLAFFPLLLEALVALTPWPRSRRDRVLWATTLATCVAFAAIKTLPWAGELYRRGLGLLQWPWYAFVALLEGRAAPPPRRVTLWPDPTDLVALPAAFIALALRWRAQRRART